MAARKIVVLGSTGSVGVSTLNLLAQAGAEVDVLALTAGRNAKLLLEQALRWRPRRVVIEDERLAPELARQLAGSGVDVLAGSAAVAAVAGGGADWVMAAIVGVAGLAPTLAAARSGAIVALANKESLVCVGPTLLEIARQAGGRIIPVDSEHSAIFQVFEPGNASHVRRLILTASGGPFRTWTAEAMAAATPAQAIAHPNWSMGAKISVDSATLMNKGLELIEAAYLFDMAPEKVDVIVHPQSVVHSLVEYADGSTLAQLGAADMRTPIACAWEWPARTPWAAESLDLARIGSLTFESPDLDRFPALRLAREALAAGPVATASLNAANEVAVGAFLDRRIGFLDIASVVRESLERAHHQRGTDPAGEDPVERAVWVDAEARRLAAQVLSRFERNG